jgi:hypothetical protein
MRSPRMSVVMFSVVTAASAAASPQAPKPASSKEAVAQTPAALALKQDMRKLWTDHVV